MRRNAITFTPSRELPAETLEHDGTTARISAWAEAIDTLRSDSRAVLLSDIAVPGEDGYSLIRQVRRSRPRRRHWYLPLR